MKFLFAILAATLLFSAAAKALTTNSLSDAEIQGRQLAQQLCDARPMTNFAQTGTLKIRDAKRTTNIIVSISTRFKNNTWINNYCSNWRQYLGDNTNVYVFFFETISVIHTESQPSRYEKNSSSHKVIFGMAENPATLLRHPTVLAGDEMLTSFAGSDFWLCDLGLEFFHWPAQKILPKTTNLKRGRDYTLLESTNPNPPTNGYSRVLSWIDKETAGILQAEAYDAAGKLLKVFEPKSFKKVNGQWELQEMEIRNVQTGSRTRLEFDLKSN